jgi:predicted dehydrogenase
LDTLRLAIVGCGTISQLNVPGYLQDDRCEVTALCDPIPERAEVRAREWGISPRIHTSYEDVLNDSDVDAVELLTPTPLHPAQIVAGLDAGKHVSCQKPIAKTMAEVEGIAAAVGRAKTKFRITEHFLFYPPILKAKELLDAGAIGEPSMVRLRTVRGPRTLEPGLRWEPGSREWRRDSEANVGGMMYDDGWHKYATAMFWIGGFEKVYSMITKTDDFIIEAPSVALWKFEGRDCLGVMDYAYADEMPIRSKYYPVDEFFEIQGSKGAIWMTRCTGEMLDMPPVMLLTGSETVGYRVPSDWIEGFNGSARNFVDCVLRDEQPDMDVEFSKRVLQATLAIYEASRTDRPVAPDSIV